MRLLTKLKRVFERMANAVVLVLTASTVGVAAESLETHWQWGGAPLLGLFLSSSVICYPHSYPSPTAPLISHSCQEWRLLSAARPFCKCSRSLWSGSRRGKVREEVMMRREEDPAAGVGQGGGKIPVWGVGKEADNDASSLREERGRGENGVEGAKETSVTMLLDQRLSCPLQKINSLFAQCQIPKILLNHRD